jgi:hypothetical protein
VLSESETLATAAFSQACFSQDLLIHLTYPCSTMMDTMVPKGVPTKEPSPPMTDDAELEFELSLRPGGGFMMVRFPSVTTTQSVLQVLVFNVCCAACAASCRSSASSSSRGRDD